LHFSFFYCPKVCIVPSGFKWIEIYLSTCRKIRWEYIVPFTGKNAIKIFFIYEFISSCMDMIFWILEY